MIAIKKLLLLALLTLLFPIFLLAETFKGTVLGVSDGDTITVMHHGKGELIRLREIDAPEKDQYYMQKARKFVSDICLGKEVTVTTISKDQYGRTIAEVYLSNGINLSNEIVRNGYAWWSKKYSADNKELEALELVAKKERKGLWAGPKPMSPWDFKKSEQENKSDIVSSVNGNQLPIIGNKNSAIYHLPNCKNYTKVAPQNKVIFQTEEDARLAGFSIDKNCH